MNRYPINQSSSVFAQIPLFAPQGGNCLEEDSNENKFKQRDPNNISKCQIFVYTMMVTALLILMYKVVVIDNATQRQMKQEAQHVKFVHHSLAAILQKPYTVVTPSPMEESKKSRLSSLIQDFGLLQSNMQVSPLLTSANSPERKTIIDVGANNGEDYSVHGLKKHHKVFAFEPMPDNWKEFQNTLTANALWSKVVPISVKPGKKAILPAVTKHDELYFIQAAASDRTTNLTVSHRGLMTSIVEQQFFNNPAAQSYEIATVKIDDIVDEDIFLFKTDTQGHEYAVLKGAEKLLRTRKVKYLTLEFWPAAITHSGSNPLELLNFIADLGFECSDASNNMHNSERHVPLHMSGDFAEYVKALERTPPKGDFIGLWSELFCWRD